MSEAIRLLKELADLADDATSNEIGQWVIDNIAMIKIVTAMRQPSSRDEQWRHEAYVMAQFESPSVEQFVERLGHRMRDVRCVEIQTTRSETAEPHPLDLLDERVRMLDEICCWLERHGADGTASALYERKDEFLLPIARIAAALEKPRRCPSCGVASPGSHTAAIEHAPGCTATPLQRLMSVTSTGADHDAEDRAFGASADEKGDL